MVSQVSQVERFQDFGTDLPSKGVFQVGHESGRDFGFAQTSDAFEDLREANRVNIKRKVIGARSGRVRKRKVARGGPVNREFNVVYKC